MGYFGGIWVLWGVLVLIVRLQVFLGVDFVYFWVAVLTLFDFGVGFVCVWCWVIGYRYAFPVPLLY